MPIAVNIGSHLFLNLRAIVVQEFALATQHSQPLATQSTKFQLLATLDLAADRTADCQAGEMPVELVSVADLTQKIVVLCIRSASKSRGLAGSTDFGINRARSRVFEPMPSHAVLNNTLGVSSLTNASA